MSEPKRINKFLSESGFCSRREADRLVEKGQVFINGKKAEMGSKVLPGNTVKVNGKVISNEVERVYIAFNKPVGVVSTTDKKEKHNIVNYINYPQRIFHIGRLDKDSQGLILLTNDGDIVNKILRAGNNHEKEYIVTVNKPITDDFVKKMSSGVPILGTVTKPCKVEKIAPNIYRIILIEGMNRQIRRMSEFCGYEVKKLERIRIMNIDLRGLGIGDWRELTPKEMAEMDRLIADSVKTEDASI